KLRAAGAAAHRFGMAATRPGAVRRRQAAPARPAPPRGFPAFGLSSLPLAVSSDEHGEQHRPRQGDRQHDDVQHLERGAELLDAAVQVTTNGTQLLTDAQLLVEKALDFLLLLRAHQERRRIVALRLELGETALGLGKL